MARAEGAASGYEGETRATRYPGIPTSARATAPPRVRFSGRMIELLPDGDWQISEGVWRRSADFLTLLESRGVRVRGVKRPVDTAA